MLEQLQNWLLQLIQISHIAIYAHICVVFVCVCVGENEENSSAQP